MAVSKEKKQQTVSDLKEIFAGCAAVVAADNQGLTVVEANELRSKARETGCTVKVAKNTLIQHALRESGKGEGFGPFLLGPTILITHEEDPVTPAKVFADFAKAHEKLVLKAGLLGEEVLDAKGVDILAKLPGKDELRGQFAGLVNSLAGVVYFSAQNLLGEFCGLVDAQKEKAA